MSLGGSRLRARCLEEVGSGLDHVRRTRNSLTKKKGTIVRFEAVLYYQTNNTCKQY